MCGVYATLRGVVEVNAKARNCCIGDRLGEEGILKRLEVTLMPGFQFIAVFAALLFTGAAIYINLVEHAARMECGTALATSVFGPSYRRAAVMRLSWRSPPRSAASAPGSWAPRARGPLARW